MQEFDYKGFLTESGIGNGDIVDVVSDLRSMMLAARRSKCGFSPDHLIDSLKEIVGCEGTVLIRCFNWDFCHDMLYDIKSSPSQVGSLGNIALKRDDFIRTAHPIYSWMVWGKYKDELTSMTNISSFGEDSPFDFLYRHDGMLLNIGETSVVGFTHAHYVEQKLKMPYRFEKMFHGQYKDMDGNVTQRDYSMYVRYLDYDIYTELYPDVLGELVERKVVKKKEALDLPLYSIKLREACDFLADDLQNNMGLRTCVINEQKGYKYALDNPPYKDDPNMYEDPDDVKYPQLGASIKKK